MIHLKTEVVKKHLIEQLKAEAELTYKNSWQPKLQERAFIDGAEALFKLLRLGDVSESVCVCKYPVRVAGDRLLEPYCGKCFKDFKQTVR